MNYYFLYWLACFCFVFKGSNVLCDRTVEHLLSCTNDSFICSNENCIDSSLTCDGHADCLDGSDETQSLCSKLFTKCPGLAFRCKYGACINKNLICDGNKDCVDGSDESAPECRVNSQIGHASNNQQNSQSVCQNVDEFKCMNGQCIDNTSICDGVQDCRDGSDETASLCANISCPKYTFKCRYGACIRKESKCNGVKNCIDGSDEQQCPTKPISKPKPPIVVHSNTEANTHFTTETNTQSNTEFNTQFNKKKCEIPDTEGSIYSYINSNKILSPGSLVDQNQVINENCKEGYFKIDRYRHMRCIENGQWEMFVTDKLCLKMCPALTSDNLKFDCFTNGVTVDCSKPMQNSTRAIPSCKSTHKLPNGIELIPTVLICLPDGHWDGLLTLFKCVPSCGRVYVQHQVLISGGNNASVGTAPWNVGIYEKNDQSSYDMICGGTLISENLVVSAAHCFDRSFTGTDKVIINNGIYKIGIGKYKRDIAIKDNPYTQIVDALYIHANRDYFGSVGNYFNDIAIIVLPSKVIISDIVLPACIDWDRKYTISNGTPGKIVGWGKTETLKPSNILLEASLPYIDQNTCRSIQKNGFQIFVTADKFCAGSKSGQAVHEGDSGSGLTFVQNNAHYLTGIVSVDDPNIKDSIALFTDVRYHVEWIRKLYYNLTSV